MGPLINYTIPLFLQLIINKKLIMYIPGRYQMNNRSEIVNFMKAYSFATIVTVEDHIPTATHLPFVITDTENEISLSAHFAKANNQWKQLAKNKVLVIFAEPHAYISPNHYDSKLNVPTWNYVSVHTYGMAEIITDTDDGMAELEKMINVYEQAYMRQWEKFPSEMKLKLLKAIVPFRIKILEIQAKEKLSQNKNQNERQRIVDALQKSHQSTEKDMAAFMQKNQ